MNFKLLLKSALCALGILVGVVLVCVALGILYNVIGISAATLIVTCTVITLFVFFTLLVYSHFKEKEVKP